MLEVVIIAAICVLGVWAAGKGLASFYSWAWNRGYERCSDNRDQVEKWEFDNLKSRVDAKIK